MLNTIVAIVLSANILLIEFVLLYGILKKKQVKRINNMMKK